MFGSSRWSGLLPVLACTAVAGFSTAVAQEPTTPSSEHADDGVGCSRDSGVVFLGILANEAGNGSLLEPGFLEADLSDLEEDISRWLQEDAPWKVLSLENRVSNRALTEGTVLFAAVVVSRAEVTRTVYEALRITKHSAWVTLSLEFFNLRSRAIYFSSARSGVKSFDSELADLNGETRTRLLVDALRELAPMVVAEAKARFDPDCVQGIVLPSKGDTGTWELMTSATVGIGPGQVMHSVKSVCGIDSSPRPCRFRAVQVGGERVLLRQDEGDRPTSGLMVYTYANKKDPPGVRTFQVAPLVPYPGGRELDGDLDFLQMQLHGQLAAAGRIRLLPPIDVAFGPSLRRRYEASLDLLNSEINEIMERSRPFYLIRSAVAKLERQFVRANAIESEEAFVALLATRISEVDWNVAGENGEPKRTPVTAVLYGKGLALNRILPGKRVVERDLFLVAAQEAVADLATQILAAVETLGRGPAATAWSVP